MSDVLRLLAHLHRGGTYAYLWILPDRRSYWGPAKELPPVPAGPFNVYFGVHPTVKIPPTNSRGEAVLPEGVRAQIPYIAAINGLFAEFDSGQFEGDKERILAHIGGLAQRPSVVIDSGGGYHAYWLLKETFYLDSPETREHAMRTQAAWVEHVGGDPGAKDLARVLRLPDPQAGWRARIAQERAPALTLSLIDALFRSPMVTIPQVAKLLNVTYHSAQRHVDRLVQAGVLVQVADRIIEDPYRILVCADKFQTMKDDTELFKQFSDNEAFRRGLAEAVFALTYAAAGQHL